MAHRLTDLYAISSPNHPILHFPLLIIRNSPSPLPLHYIHTDDKPAFTPPTLDILAAGIGLQQAVIAENGDGNKGRFGECNIGGIALLTSVGRSS